VSEAGFFPSVGKNLFSPNVAQINSVLFRIKYHIESEYSLDNLFTDMRSSPIKSIERVNYINFGLLTSRGKGRLGGTDTVKTGTCAQFTSNEDLNMAEGFARLPVLFDIWRDLNSCGNTFDNKVLRRLFKKHHLECFGVLRDQKVDFFGLSALPFNSYAGCGAKSTYSLSRPGSFWDRVCDEYAYFVSEDWRCEYYPRKNYYKRMPESLMLRDAAAVCSGMKKTTTDVEIIRNLKRIIRNNRIFPFSYLDNPFDVELFDQEELISKPECPV